MICRFIVRKVRMKKYMTKMGQNTGMSNSSKNVQENAKIVDFMVDNLDFVI